MMSNPVVDLELKKHFEELQIQVQDSRGKMRQIDSQINSLKTNCAHSTITRTEILSLPEGIRTYESLGRMFVLRDVKDIQTMLEERVKSNEEKMKSLESNKKYLETGLKSKENSIRELIARKQQTTGQK